VTSNFHSALGSGATTGGGSAGDETRPPTCGVSGDSDSPGPLPVFFFSGAGAGGGGASAAGGAGGGAAGGGAAGAGAGVWPNAEAVASDEARKTSKEEDRDSLRVVIIIR